MTCKLSIIMPAIRQERWVDLYKSIVQSCSQNFELILVSPYKLPEILEKSANIKYVKDYGSPSRCFNIALSLAEGEYCTWGADDGLYQDGVLDKAIKILDESKNYKKIVSMATVEDVRHYSEQFCYINNHQEISSPYIPNDYRLLALAMMRTSYFRELGGVDCRYETHAISHIDLSIRCQNDGAEIEFLQDICMRLGHMPGTSGDHAPMHFAQIEHDENLYRSLYRNKEYNPINRIDLFNWKSSPIIWSRRFTDV